VTPGCGGPAPGAGEHEEVIMQARTAPPSAIVKVISTVFVAATALAVVLLIAFPGEKWLMLLALALALALGWAYLRTPVGYEMRGDRLIVHLRVGSKRFGPVIDYEPVTEPISFAVRLWGNGGLFAVTGLYRNRVYGRFRAYVTNLESLVLVETRDAEKIVISPANAEAWTLGM
jgi:hypothetical protein